MANGLAFVALLGWPLIAILIFRLQRNLEKAIIWLVLGPFLFLPSGLAIDLPGVPPLEKVRLSTLVLVVLLVLLPGRQFRMIPKSRAVRLLLLLLLIGQFLTVLTNPDPFWVGGRRLEGNTLYDALSNIFQMFLLIAPLLIGRAFLSTPEAQRKILGAMILGGLVYSLLVLIEVRLSPQLSKWIYGYFPHSFAQHVRGGGYRPIVFLQHGLWVAFFMMTTFIAAAILWRQARAGSGESGERHQAGRYLLGIVYLGIILVLCKSLGSLFFGIFLLPIVLFLSLRLQLWIAVALVSISVTYPFLRSAGLVPVDRVYEIAQSINEKRAASFLGRLTNEDLLLAHAERRPLFGWGSWGRNRIYNEETGEDISTTDGYWIIIFGRYGWAGFIALFGLLALPVFLFARLRRAGYTRFIGPVQSGLCLLVAINMVELLPNATLPPLTWLIVGSLIGYAEKIRDGTLTAAPADAGPPKRVRTYL